MPIKEAELIEGEVFVPSPVRQRYHGRQHSHLNFWLSAYEGGTPGVEVGDNSTVGLNLENMPQPDCVLFVQPEHGGQVRIGENGYIEARGPSGRGRREQRVTTWAGSSAPTNETGSASTLCGGFDQQIDWFVLRDGHFELLLPRRRHRLCSTIFPGLWLDLSALLRTSAPCGPWCRKAYVPRTMRISSPVYSSPARSNVPVQQSLCSAIRGLERFRS